MFQGIKVYSAIIDMRHHSSLMGPVMGRKACIPILPIKCYGNIDIDGVISCECMPHQIYKKGMPGLTFWWHVVHHHTVCWTHAECLAQSKQLNFMSSHFVHQTR